MESFEEWFSELALEEACIIVEGKNDKAALSTFEIKNCICISNLPTYKLIDYLIEKDITSAIILTDLDKEGRHLYHKLKSALQRHGISIIEKYRDFLLKQKKPTNIESLSRLAHSCNTA